MLKVSFLTFVLMALVSLSFSVNAGDFVKNGNNGTVSCNTFCGAAKGEEPVWGSELGYCKSATNESTGETESCNTVPGFLPNSKQLTCGCNSDVFVKRGNNGTVSCSNFCRSSNWGGGTGKCVAAWNTKTDKLELCTSVPGFLAGAELSCTCRSK